MSRKVIQRRHDRHGDRAASRPTSSSTAGGSRRSVTSAMWTARPSTPTAAGPPGLHRQSHASRAAGARRLHMRRLRHRHAGGRGRGHDVHHRLRDPAGAGRTQVVAGRMDGRAEPSAHVDFGFHMAVTHWDEAHARGRGPADRRGHAELQGLHGARWCAQGQRRRSARPPARDRGARRAHHGARRERRRYRLSRGPSQRSRTDQDDHCTPRRGRSGRRRRRRAGRSGWRRASMHRSSWSTSPASRAADEVARARARGVPVRAETCTHYLTLSTADLRRPSTRRSTTSAHPRFGTRRTRTGSGEPCARIGFSQSPAITVPTATHRNGRGSTTTRWSLPGLPEFSTDCPCSGTAACAPAASRRTGWSRSRRPPWHGPSACCHAKGHLRPGRTPTWWSSTQLAAANCRGRRPS